MGIGCQVKEIRKIPWDRKVTTGSQGKPKISNILSILDPPLKML